MASPSLDPVSVAAAVLAGVIGQQMAPVVGAYTVILFAWLGGVMVGLWRRDPTSRMSAAVFVGVSFVLTLGSTALAAEQLAQHLGVDSTALLFPAAFLIPAIGESWVDFGRWAIELVKGRFSKGQ